MSYTDADLTMSGISIFKTSGSIVEYLHKHDSIMHVDINISNTCTVHVK